MIDVYECVVCTMGVEYDTNDVQMHNEFDLCKPCYENQESEIKQLERKIALNRRMCEISAEISSKILTGEKVDHLYEEYLKLNAEYKRLEAANL